MKKLKNNHRLVKVLEKFNITDFSKFTSYSFWIGNVAIIIAFPFVINNLQVRNMEIAYSSLLVMLTFLFNTFYIWKFKKPFTPLYSFIVAPTLLYFLYHTTISLGIYGALWSFPTIIAFYYILPERIAWAFNIITIIMVSYLCWNIIDQALAIRVIATSTLVSLFTAVSIRLITGQYKYLKTLAINDNLTNIYNRNAANKIFNYLFVEKPNQPNALFMLLIDVDYFKKINDEFGHDIGDEYLKNIAINLRDSLSQDGILFRYGGEEFLMIVDDKSYLETKEMAEKIRNNVQNIKLKNGNAITVSIGLGELKPEMNQDDWLKACDQNLYLAKENGRNCIVG